MANGNKRKKSNNQMPTVMQRVVVAVILFTIFFYFSGVLKNEPLSLQQPKEISLSEFTNFVSGKQVETAVKKDYTVQGKLKDGMLYKVYITEFDPELTKLMRDNVKDFRVNIANPFFSNFFWPVLFPLIVLMLFWYLLSRSAQAGGGRIMSFGKSRARQFMGGQVKITFNDVAGVD